MKKTLIILAAGMGSRYGGLKQTDGFGPAGETLADYSVYDAARAGFEKFVFVIKKETEDLFRKAVGDRIAANVDTAFVHQESSNLPGGHRVPPGRIKPWGTGHAVLCCAEEIEGPFAVVNADDFYGRDAFVRLAEGMRDDAGEVPEYLLVGYRLCDTLSENGFVSRGVCETKDGFLTDIVERTRIRREADGRICYTDDAGNRIPLAEDTTVSMNCWGFTPAFLPDLRERFEAFLANLRQPETEEFYLPFAVRELMRGGRCVVRVRESPGNWYGVTYREDRETVVRALARMTEQGRYPNGLWK